MLGPPKSRRLDEPIAVSLDDLVPRAHFYRHLEAKLDLGFVREWARECYADRGRPSIDPIVFFKLQLVMFFEGIRSERQLIETASLHLAHRWYLGYALDEDLPDHSSLTRFRERLGLPIFRRFFARVVELCRDAGLVWGRELLVDATKVRGNAAMDSLVPRLAEVVDGHLVPLFGGGTKAEEPGPGTDGEAPRLLHPTAASDPAAGQDGEPRWDLLEECRLDPDRPLSPGYRRLSAHRVSRTDPDATPMTMADKRTALGYQTHYLVDGGKARIILHALVTPADVMENQPLLDQLRRAIFRWKLRPERLIADTTYVRRPSPATPAPSKRSARRATTGGGSTARFMPSIWSASAATTKRPPTPRRCASAKSGSSRCSPRQSSGTGWSGSGCGGCRR
jgi:transposase